VNFLPVQAATQGSVVLLRATAVTAVARLTAIAVVSVCLSVTRVDQ